MQMAHLYSSASIVLVWLGGGTDNAMSGLTSGKWFTNWAGEPVRSRTPYIPTRLDYSRAACEDNKIGYWEAVYHTRFGSWEQSKFEQLSRNGYWGRLWIIQEVLLARRLFIRYGSEEVEWVDLEFMEGGFQKYQRSGGRTPSTLEDSYATGGMRALLCLRRQRGPHTWTWCDMIWFSRRAQCKDVRDRIYGMLGFVDSAVSLHVDYELSTPDLFLTVLRKELEFQTDSAFSIASQADEDQ
jgi:hypothetical protein